MDRRGPAFFGDISKIRRCESAIKMTRYMRPRNLPEFILRNNGKLTWYNISFQSFLSH